LILGIGLLLLGIQGIYEAIAHGKQRVVTYDQFVKSHPKEGWYKITNCVLSVPEAVWAEKRGRIDEAYVPVYDGRKDAKEGEKTFLLLKTEDDGVLEPLTGIQKMDENLSEAQVSAYMLKNKEQLFQHKDLEGMLQFGLNATGETRDKVAGLNKELAADFVILEQNKKPSLWGSVGMTVGGLVILAIIVLGFLGKKSGE
jgi:hypothetical protein